ncbi:MAG: hypothetical protein K6L73_02045 [Cellvibrionaceae bacterium]
MKYLIIILAIIASFSSGYWFGERDKINKQNLENLQWDVVTNTFLESSSRCLMQSIAFHGLTEIEDQEKFKSLVKSVSLETMEKELESLWAFKNEHFSNKKSVADKAIIEATQILHEVHNK